MCIWIPVNLEDLEDHRCIDMYSCQKDLSRFKLTKKQQARIIVIVRLYQAKIHVEWVLYSFVDIQENC